MKRMLILLAVLPAGCQTVGPTWSELSGARYHMTIADRRPVMITAIDGASTPLRGRIDVAPGRHEIEVESFRHGIFRGGYRERLVIDVAPCRRYYINAQYRDPVQPNYQPVVDEVEVIAGCRATAG